MRPHRRGRLVGIVTLADLRRPPATCTSNDTITEAAKIMHEHKCGFVPVVDGRGSVIGVVTDRDASPVVGDKNRAMTHVSVQDAMSPPVSAVMRATT